MTRNSSKQQPPVSASAREGNGAKRSLSKGGKILAERAKRLAREPVAEQGGERLEVVEFLLGHERYGLETSFIREVHPLRELTPLPCTPSFVLGIINLRGEVISVVDIRQIFQMAAPGPAESNMVIVLQSAAMRFGMLADAVLGVRSVFAGGVQPSIAAVTGIGADYLKGVTRDHLVLLDAGKMLADRRLVVHEEV